MKQHRGRLLYNGQIVLDDIRVALQFSSRKRNTSWRGQLELPVGASVQAGGPYDLVLCDGRSGRVLLRNSLVNFGTFPGEAEFLGAGPIERHNKN